MHPLIVTPLYPPATGGAATYFGMVVPELLACATVERLTVLTERLSDQPGEWTDGKLRILRRLPSRISVPPRNRGSHAAGYALTQLWFALQLPRLVRRLRVDLIDVHTRYRGPLVYTALRRSGVPIIADLHDKMTRPATLKGIADWLLCCGEGVQRFAVAGGFPVDRIVFVRLPMAAPDVPSADRVAALRRHHGLGDVPYLLFVGDITSSKGVYELLAAYRQWRSEPPQARLAFAGTNREGTRFLRQIQHTPGATYLGRMPHEDALALMRAAEIVVLPSRSEGLPYVILEAVALGARVIAPPGVPEFDAHLQGAVLPEVSVPAIVRLLTMVWARHDPTRYPLALHEPRRAVQSLLELYTRAVGGSGAPRPRRNIRA
ncbi:MAG TPA: glycosyltransferase family 4 protein [Candidatus Acidoferrales bacterium]|nr:glycosyltransferase family 4 protein [Candidatus Acidoferrales bacterium]